MKRFFALLLTVSLVLSGCSLGKDTDAETVTFYYPLEEFQFGQGLESVIGSEERESASSRDNLSYLLALYLMGPLEDGLRSPVPPSIKIVSTEVKSGKVLLILTDSAQVLSDTGFTLACACLTLTCLELTEAEEVTVTSGERTATMTRSSLILFDRGPAAGTEETQ